MSYSFFFFSGASPDNKKSEISICQVRQGGIGLPDRDYYFDEDKEDKRKAYKAHIAKMLSLLHNTTQKSISSQEESGTCGDNNNVVDESFTTIAHQIYDLESQLAKAHMTKTENRDPGTTYNKMSVEALTKLCENKFDFGTYFVSATKKTIDELGDINIRNALLSFHSLCGFPQYVYIGYGMG